MEQFPEAEFKKMFGYPCAFYQGNMFVGLHQHNMIVWLDKKELEQAFNRQDGGQFEPMEGRVMRECLSLSENTLKDSGQVASFVGKSLDYAKTLPKKVKKAKNKK